VTFEILLLETVNILLPYLRSKLTTKSNTNLNHKPKPTMKKFIYAVLFAFTIATTFTACTEENVKPKTNEGGTGGGAIDPKG
jgi:hypothetical protein